MFGTACEHTKNEETLIIHCGKKQVIAVGEKSVDSVPAIHVSTSHLFASAQDVLDVSKGEAGYVYRRCGNENCMDLSIAVAQLEGASEAVCMSCGMGAISSAFIAAGVMKGGKKILGPYSCYGSTYTLLTSRFVDISTCELTDMGNTAATVAHIARFQPDILYMETSSNPLTVVPDIALLVSEAKKANPNCVTIIDNTFATPLLVKPISLGVDLVLHSMTKYLNGHGDALAGIVCSNSSALMDEVRAVVIEFGTILSPWDAWMVQRGLRTLGVRMDAIGRNALAIAKHLKGSRAVSRLLYPGLPSHPQFSAVLSNAARPYSETEIADGIPFSGMIAFDINVADEVGVAAATVFLDSLRLVSNQVSLGDVKTLASAPGLSTQHQVPEGERELIGIRPSTIRLSVGMEHIEDICADIDQALREVSRQFPLGAEQAPEAEAAAALARVAVSVPEPAARQEEGIAALQARRVARLKTLYDQMAAISAEMEGLQQLVKADAESLMRRGQQENGVA